MAKRRANGEGTVYQRPNGTWSAQVSYIDPGTGTRKRKTISGKTKQEVLRKKRELETLKDAGRLVDTGKLTVEAWMNRWLEVYKKPALKPSTWLSYKQLTDLHINPALGNRQLDRLQASEIQAFYNYLSKSGRKIKKRKEKKKKDAENTAQAKPQNPGLSTRTVRYIHTILNGALNQAMKENLIRFNPAAVTEPPRLERKETRPLTAKEARDFLDAIKDDMLYPIILTDLGTGLRRGELLGLKWEDIDLETGTAIIRRSLLQLQGQLHLQEDTKTKASKATIQLPGEVVKVLKQVKRNQAQAKLILGEGYNDKGFVFAWGDGRPIRPDYLYHRFKALLKDNKLPEVRIHDLRHTFCTLLLEAGEDLSTVSKLARHSSYSITADIYGHLTKTMQERAAGKMDAILTRS